MRSAVGRKAASGHFCMANFTTAPAVAALNSIEDPDLMHISENRNRSTQMLGFLLVSLEIPPLASQPKGLGSSTTPHAHARPTPWAQPLGAGPGAAHCPPPRGPCWRARAQPSPGPGWPRQHFRWGSGDLPGSLGAMEVIYHRGCTLHRLKLVVYKLPPKPIPENALDLWGSKTRETKVTTPAFSRPERVHCFKFIVLEETPFP